MKRSVYWAMLTGILFFSSCKTIEPVVEMPFPLTIPESFSIGAKGSDVIEEWWLSFGSEELNGLMKTALHQNFGIKTYRAKINQENARLAKESASFFPNLGFSMGGQKRESQVKSSSSTRYDSTHSWESALTGAYTADVWGKAGARKQAQVVSLEAANQALKQSELELTAQIAETWIDIIAARNKKSILENQIKTNKTLLDLQRLRFANGKANALDVSQQREALAEAKSQIPLLEKQEQLLLNSLAFLTGKTAIDTVSVMTQTLPKLLPLPGVGIPTDLLENRPDIKAARLRLTSSQWEISAARADLFPSFKLTAQALFSSGKLELLFQNWVATLAGSIAGPIFDGGFQKAEIKRAKAFAEEQLNSYAREVAGAIREVEDTLISIQKQEAYIKLLEEELSVVRLTLKDARVQYQNGQSSYLSYLIAWTSIQRLERQLVGEQAISVKDRIRLCKALGWKSVK